MCIFSSAGHNPKQIFRWEDQEIYYFSMALKEFGKNYEYISKIIETKQVRSLTPELSPSGLSSFDF